MNKRERYLAVALHGKPDRIPFMPGGPRESTLKAWHGQGLLEGANWLDALVSGIGLEGDIRFTGPGVSANFAMVPEFEKKIIERKESSIIVQDWKGNICEISDKYGPEYLGGSNSKFDFVTRRWLKCPVENHADWEQMKERYKSDDPARFASDVEVRAEKAKNRDYVTSFSFSGLFWQLREWMGFEGLCMAFIEQPEFVRAMIEFWENFVSQMLEKVFAYDVPDIVLVNEDMAYKEKAMISPAMVREFILPAWTRWGRQIREAGCPVYSVDSDGYVGELIPLWIEAGFNQNCPQEVAAGNDLPAYSRRYGDKMGYTGGIDKRAMAKGGDVIRSEIERVMPAIKVGGYIPGCDHGIPPDVSWPCMLEYARLLAKATGWI